MKTRLMLLFILFTSTVCGQTVKIKSHSLLNLASEGKAFYPVFNPDGTQLLYTTENYKGLNLYNIQTREKKLITTDEGAGYSPSFSNDSKQIYYRQVSRKLGRQYKTLMSFDATSQKTATLSEPIRNVRELVKLQKKATKRGILSSVSVCTENLKIVLYRNGNRTEMEPLGKVAGYIWTSLSPNGQMILFTAASKGTFVCDLTGKVIATLGKINAPVWYDNEYVVGMEDKDDGSFITSSKIVIASVDGKLRQNLTSDEMIALYPAASSVSKRIAYCTQKGELFIMEIEINH